jgi:hypothetical protein
MKMKILFLTILISLIVSTFAKGENSEKLLGLTFDYDKKEVTLQVVSSGCTQKSDFKFEIKGDSLTIIRIRPDNCKMMESIVQFTFRLKEIKIDPNKAYIILNKFIANHNIARIQ